MALLALGDFALQLAGNHERDTGEAPVGAAPLLPVAVTGRAPVEPLAAPAFDGEVGKGVRALGVADALARTTASVALVRVGVLS